MTDAMTWMDAAHRDTSLSDGAVRLAVLLARDDCSVRGESVITTDDLADRLGCSASTAARRINELAEAGYLADRSKKRVTLAMPDADAGRTDEPDERTSEPTQLTDAPSAPTSAPEPVEETVEREPKLAAKEARADEPDEAEESTPSGDTSAELAGIKERLFDDLDRMPVDESERMDFMRLQQEWRRHLGGFQQADRRQRDRARVVRAYFTSQEIQQAMEKTYRQADQPSWGYFRAVLEGQTTSESNAEKLERAHSEAQQKLADMDRPKGTGTHSF